MSTNTPASPSGASEEKTEKTAKTEKTDNRVFVEIPKAGPGQGYRAPKNYASPAQEGLGRLLVYLMCAALIVAPAFVVFWICFAPGSHALQLGFAWLWIVMFLLTEAIGVFCAIGIGREALGTAGESYTK